MPRILRPYQLASLDAIDAAVSAGQRSGVIALATGLGKTVTAANAIKRRIHLGRALFTAPLDAVVSQSAVAIQAELPANPVGIVKAQLNQINSQIVVASLQTLARERRIAQLEASAQTHGAFQTIVIDECHLQLDAYKKVIARLAAPNAVVIGLSATPYRLDGRGLDEVFETVFSEMDIVRGIREGYLVEPDALRFQLKGADFSRVHVKKGDLEAKELEEVMKSANFAEQITKHWQEHASDRRTVVFLPKVEMAYELAEFMRAGGIRAEALDGGTGKTDRRAIFARYESGETQVLCNVLVLSTGWDSPITDCLVMARPTQSKALYLQAMGRGLRTLPRVIDGLDSAEERLAAIAASAKPSCLVMDMIGVTGRHKLMTVADLAGTEKPKERRKLTELVEDAEVEKQEAAERERIEAELVAQRVKLIDGTSPQFNWRQDGKESFHLRLKGKPELGQFEVWRNDDKEPWLYAHRDGQVKAFNDGVLSADSEVEAKLKCEQAAYSLIAAKPKRQPFSWQSDFFKPGNEVLHVKDTIITVRKMADGSWIAADNQGQFRFINGQAETCKKAAEEHAKKVLFSDQNAPWRGRPASDSQLARLRQWRIPYKDGITKGEASDAIGRFLEAKKERVSA